MTLEEMKEALNGLLEKGLVIKSEKGYKLTSIGRMIADKLDEQKERSN